MDFMPAGAIRLFLIKLLEISNFVLNTMVHKRT